MCFVRCADISIIPEKNPQQNEKKTINFIYLFQLLISTMRK